MTTHAHRSRERAHRRFASVLLLAAVGLACATPAWAGYFAIARAGASVGNGSCTDLGDSGVLVAPSASASALGCLGAAAEAFADISTASMGLLVSADSTSQAVSIANAEAEFFDVVHFQVPPDLEGQPFELGVFLEVDGVMTSDAAPQVSVLHRSRCILTDLGSFAGYDGLVIDQVPTSGRRIFPGTLTITPPSYAMNVSMHILAPGLVEGTVDYRATSRLLLDLPPGVTYGSDSGVFQAPEPGATALGAAITVTLVAAHRRPTRSLG